MWNGTLPGTRLARLASSYVNGATRYAVHAGAKVTTPARCSPVELSRCRYAVKIDASEKRYNLRGSVETA